MNGPVENRTVLKVDGMTCGHCVARVQKALDETSGVVEAKVDLDSGIADIRSDKDPDTAALIAAVEEAGYIASPA